MQKKALSTVWAIAPTYTVEHGETVASFALAPREIKNANIQTDYNEVDIAAYGERLKEMLRMRFMKAPDLQIGDHVYFEKPVENKPGDYEVIAIKMGYSDSRLVRNPTIVDLKKVTL